jgi:hypothetical protein
MLFGLIRKTCRFHTFLIWASCNISRR